MTVLENQMLEALRDLDDAARSLRTGEASPDLKGLLTRIDALTLQLPTDTAPDLLHFLHRKSYQKALEFLSTSEHVSGPSGGHA